MSRKHKRHSRRAKHAERLVQHDASERKVEGGWDDDSRANEKMNPHWEVQPDDVDR
jgi:hypothetical protein